MSKIALSGNASGTGTFTIASPNSNSDRTLNLPDNSGTVLTTGSTFSQNSGPAFSAYANAALSVTANTITKLQFQVEEFDTANCFDSTTNYRFTPNIAGYYQINAAFSGADRVYYVIYLYRNGVQYKNTNDGNGTTSVGAAISSLVYFNGTTDYVEVYALSGNTQNIASGIASVWFNGSMIRSA
jgi:hypothetical protein